MIKSLYRRLSGEVRAYRLALSDPRTPRSAKRLLRFTFAYLLSPIDLIPDAIPVLGLLDDLIILPGLLLTILWLIPAEVMADCRRRAVEREPGEGSL